MKIVINKSGFIEGIILSIRLFLLLLAVYLVYKIGLYSYGWHDGINFIKSNYYIYDLNMRCINCDFIFNRTLQEKLNASVIGIT